MTEGHGKPCYYCGLPCDGLAGDPGKWPIPLCHRDDPGRVKWHHERCVSERLIENQAPRPEEKPITQAEIDAASKHCESAASEAIDMAISLLRNIARRSPEVLTYTDIEAFILNELNPAKVMANKDRTSCYGLMALLAKARAASSPPRRIVCCGEWDTIGTRCEDCPHPMNNELQEKS